jgi:hypothetical protein
MMNGEQLRMLILNDHELYNRRYRQPVLDELAARSISVESVGVLDSPMRLPGLALRLLQTRHGLVLSSNLRANLFTLLFARRDKVLILNGMGRYRANPRARGVILRLLGLRRNTRAIVQNYADFRYFRRFGRDLDLEWMPGSGGTAKPTGQVDTLVLVQRDAKIGVVAADVKALLDRLSVAPPLVIVGCEDEAQLRAMFPGGRWRSDGYVAAEQIFAGGSIFLQPSGYGEGFPHSLADALVSGMEIWISDREFLRYGLGRLGAQRSPLALGWSRVTPTPAVIAAVRAERVATRLCDICAAKIQKG